ncbi:MAG: hypothetical protein HKP40_01935 [Litoreibacter sp.]|nr:hypothetical protein [Litoreibacter sp.]
MKTVVFSSILAFSLSALSATADEVTDAISGAMTAYEEGDIAYATDELKFALQLLNEMKADTLVQFLPDALDGWSRELNTDMGAGLAMMGGGTGAAASYSNGSTEFTITLMADSPMVASMGSMLGNAAIMNAGGKMVRVGREKFFTQNDQLMALIGNRVLVQADGDDQQVMIAHLETMDFRELSRFGN